MGLGSADLVPVLIGQCVYRRPSSIPILRRSNIDGPSRELRNGPGIHFGCSCRELTRILLWQCSCALSAAHSVDKSIRHFNAVRSIDQLRIHGHNGVIDLVCSKTARPRTLDSLATPACIDVDLRYPNGSFLCGDARSRDGGEREIALCRRILLSGNSGLTG
jgi:hypothetical protein